MSLLIKALANAEKDKQAELQKKQLSAEALSLAPIADASVPTDALGATTNAISTSNSEHQASVSIYHASASENGRIEHTQNISQKAAASVFVANQSAKPPSSFMALLLLGVAGALLIWLGLQGYHYLRVLTTPSVVVENPATIAPIAVTATPANAQPSEMDNEGSLAVIEEPQAAPILPNTEKTQGLLPATVETALASNEGVEAKPTIKPRRILPPKPPLEERKAEALPQANTANKLQNSLDAQTTRAPLKLESKTPVAGVDPVLMAAYQAFSRGEDANAQQQYRQVLQRDVRNVDALLGMAAIALRQGREADAVGWYQKVLEIEPRNAIAQSAIASLQVNADGIGQDATSAESRIKNMLAQQPEAASLHAALGHVYAEQNQWILAQEAYFNASRYAPNSADYAFNLAVSLEHLGKTSPALAQYQRALALVNSTDALSPDKQTLAARISALQ